MLRKSLRLHKDQSKRRILLSSQAGKWLHVRSLLCLQSKRAGMESIMFGYFHHFPDSLVFIAEPYRPLHSDAALLCHCSLYQLKT